MNYIVQKNAFWDKLERESNLKPTSIAVYDALYAINNRCGWKSPFQAVYGQLLSMTGIANVKTYYSALKELADGGYIEYSKGPNQYQAASFVIKVLYQKTEEHTEEHGTQHADEHGKSMSNIPKPLNSKQKTTKGRKPFIPPSVDEVIKFFKDKGYNEIGAVKAFQHYDLADWLDTKGNPVLNWKQKMNSIWLRDEFKVNPTAPRTLVR